MPDSFFDPAIAVNRHRWALALRGALALVVGLWLLVAPLGGLVALAAAVVLLLAVDGVVAVLAAAWSEPGTAGRRLNVLQAVASLVLATVALVLPGPTLLSLLGIVAAWAIWLGVTDILAARSRGDASRLGVAGAVSIVLGIVLIALPALFMPLARAPSLVTAIALFAVVRGLLLLAAAGQGWRQRLW